MPDPCARCEIRRNCDLLSEMCDLSARQIVKYRPDLLTDANAYERTVTAARECFRSANEARKREFVPDRSMAVRYDKRRKKDSPRRQWERAYRARKVKEMRG